MLNLKYSYDVKIENAYIITLKNNQTSQNLSKRCQQSCENVSMPYKVWDAYDGTSGVIIEPENMKDDSFMQLLKVTDHYMTTSEVACALSHISLWLHCAKIDKPIVILEHDAIMVDRIQHQNSFNSIVYLGGAEWVKDNWPVTFIPPHASDGHNYHFICRAHAYCIDPTMAKNLLAHVLKMGICAPLDIMMRTDLFNVTHQGVFAYDENINENNFSINTTINGRPKEGRAVERNENLRW
jgi:GR25 family glycosyltransferase involved in LPS biosynthesis